MLSIRSIKRGDIEKVLDHAYQLAVNTKSVSDFVLTKEKLNTGLFSDKVDWYGLVVTNNQEIIASCLYSIVNTNRAFNSTPCIFLDILFVELEYQRLGIGGMLIKDLENIARENGIKRIELWCMKDNTKAIEFYKNKGAQKINLLDVYNIFI